LIIPYDHIREGDDQLPVTLLDHHIIEYCISNGKASLLPCPW
jgi:hypothetical protein